MKLNSKSYHLIGANNNYIDQIIRLKNISNLKQRFFKNFFDNIAMKNVSDADVKYFHILADESYNFIENNPQDKLKIKITPKKSIEKDNSCFTIKILTKDIPFLLDSILIHIKNYDHQIKKIFYPNLTIRRNAKNQIVQIDLPEKTTKDQESLIVIDIKFFNVDTKQIIKDLTKNLKFIIKNVQAVVNDWHKMRKISVNCRTFFDKNSIVNSLSSEEISEFLTFVESRYFIFFGTTNFEIRKGKRVTSRSTKFGIIRVDRTLDEIIGNILDDFDYHQPIYIGKTNKLSSIHRQVNLDYIIISIYNPKTSSHNVTLFIGLFTSILYYQSVTLIPIIRSKVKEVLKKTNFKLNGHDSKSIVSIIESLPRDELFRISVNDLYKMSMEIFALQSDPKLTIFTNKSKDGNYLNCLIFMAHEHISIRAYPEIESVVNKLVGTIVSYNFVHINNSKISYYNLLIKTNNNLNIDIEQFINKLEQATSSWTEKFKYILQKKFQLDLATKYYNQYSNAFCDAYKSQFVKDKNFILDIPNLENINNQRKFTFSFIDKENSDQQLNLLKLYSDGSLNLSDIIPVIQNIGFNTIFQNVYKVQKSDGKVLWLFNFHLETPEHMPIDRSIIKKNIEQALDDIWSEKTINDEYNRLMLTVGLTCREVSLVRAIAKYLHQIKFGFSKEYIALVLNKYPDICGNIVEFFKNKFDPNTVPKNREKLSKRLQNKFDELIKNVFDPSEDRVISSYLNVISAIVRTNFFKIDPRTKTVKEYLSFKIESTKLFALPKPVPFMEIFVYSSRFEAIHLRSDKVSRGGIRWSDRVEDFRTEILSLVKAQILKNSVIVPSGAKGGFVIKCSTMRNKVEYCEPGINCYKDFLRGMLDITDNLVGGKIVHPEQVVMYDTPDPYLVVAADKGTASFSDTANAIAKEYDFWLGDAFASGGSNGYDHKKMGITAKGAWVSVVRHFMELSIDYTKDNFTVVGIGDMSGDVFGNGMLLSDKIHLVGAFNHLHIFIDPNPDANKSFAERKRLFNMPRSSWLDYDINLISDGGGVYSRKSKKIQLSEQTRERFNISARSVTPDELIKCLLKAKVDLLWNGGVGTFVKSSKESNNEVGDKANDNLRIEGCALKALVVGEGGNLGLTQYGRIEYAKLGGKINTDAIDNSAGVDCSDHEVNIKIVVDQALKAHKISVPERIKLLKKMTNDIEKLVLRDNFMQTLAISVIEHQGNKELPMQERFIDILEHKGVINRKLDGIPLKEDFEKLHLEEKAITRPVLSVLIAYSKLLICSDLLKSNLPDDKYFEESLVNYFPKTIRHKFAYEIKNHPLKREIIANVITNSVVNRVASHFVHLTSYDSGHKFCDIVRAYTITRDVFELRDIWHKIEHYSNKIPVKLQLSLLVSAKKFIMRSTSWLLRNSIHDLSIGKKIDEYHSGAKKLFANMDKYLNGKVKENFEETYQKYVEQNVPLDLARKTALFIPMLSAYNIIFVANKAGIDVGKSAKTYFTISKMFELDWLMISASDVEVKNRWQKLSIEAFQNELYDTHGQITLDFVKYQQIEGVTIDYWVMSKQKYVDSYNSLLAEIKNFGKIEYTMLDLILKRLKNLLIK